MNALLYSKVAEKMGVDVEEIRLWNQRTHQTNSFQTKKTEDVFVQKKAKDEVLKFMKDENVVHMELFFREKKYKLQYVGDPQNLRESRSYLIL